MKRWCLWVVVAVVAVAGTAPAGAPATAATAAPASPRAEWLAFGVGTGHRPDNDEDLIFQQPSFLLSINVQRGRHVGSLRHARVGIGDARGDVGVLYERAVPLRRAMVIGGLGPALRYRSLVGIFTPDCDGGCLGESRRTDDGGFGGLGLAWSLEAAWRRNAEANLGVAAFGDVAREGAFWGVAVVFGFGEFK